MRNISAKVVKAALQIFLSRASLSLFGTRSQFDYFLNEFYFVVVLLQPVNFIIRRKYWLESFILFPSYFVLNLSYKYGYPGIYCQSSDYFVSFWFSQNYFWNSEYVENVTCSPFKSHAGSPMVLTQDGSKPSRKETSNCWFFFRHLNFLALNQQFQHESSAVGLSIQRSYYFIHTIQMKFGH